MGSNLIGHLHPDFIKTVEEVKTMLRTVWGTKNDLTFPISGTGSAGMETCVANLVAKDDKVLVLTNGYFGVRFSEMCRRHGAEVIGYKPDNKLNNRLTLSSVAWGKNFEAESVKAMVEKHKPKIVFVVNAETSTGVH